MCSFSEFLGQKKISSKIRLCNAQLHMGFQHHANIYKKLKIQLKANARTDRGADEMTEGQMEGRTERRADPIS